MDKELQDTFINDLLVDLIALITKLPDDPLMCQYVLTFIDTMNALILIKHQALSWDTPIFKKNKQGEELFTSLRLISFLCKDKEIGTEQLIEVSDEGHGNVTSQLPFGSIQQQESYIDIINQALKLFQKQLELKEKEIEQRKDKI